MTGVPPPPAFTTCRSTNGSVALIVSKAIFVPSGDHAGECPPPFSSGAGEPVPSALVTKTCCSLENAIFVPSGDQVG